MHTTTDRVPPRRRASRRSIGRRSTTVLVSVGAAALLAVSASPLGAASGAIGSGGSESPPPTTGAPLKKETPSSTTTPTTPTTAPTPADDGAGRDAGVLGQTDEVEVLQTSVTVNPKDDLDPNTETTLQVVGSGFDPGDPGLYVVFGPHRDSFWEHEELFLSAQFLAPGNGLNPDGTFSTTLPGIIGTYEAAGQTIDCLAEQCYVITMKAHGSTDRSQDTFTPVNFAGGATEGGGGGPSIEDVENGGTQGPGTTGPGGSGGTGGGDSLASTGTDPLVPVAVAVVLIAIGAAFVVVRRRSEHATVPVRR